MKLFGKSNTEPTGGQYIPPTNTVPETADPNYQTYPGTTQYPATAHYTTTQTAPHSTAVPIHDDSHQKPVHLVDAREVKHKKSKSILLLLWFLVMLVSAGWCAMALYTFKNLRHINNNDQGVLGSRQMWGVISASILLPACIILFFAVGTFVLITKATRESGLGYVGGWLHASLLWLAILTVQAVLTMHAYRSLANDSWEQVPQFKWDNSDSTLFSWVIWVGYALAALYLLLFLAFILLRGALKALELKHKKHPKMINTADGSVVRL